MKHRARASESELVELLDRMTDVSRSASAACAASDLQAIDTLLSARDVLLSRVGELVPQLGPITHPAIQSRLALLERVDQELNDALRSARDVARDQVADNDRQRTAVGHYTSVSRPGRLDVKW